MLTSTHLNKDWYALQVSYDSSVVWFPSKHLEGSCGTLNYLFHADPIIASPLATSASHGMSLCILMGPQEQLAQPSDCILFPQWGMVGCTECQVTDGSYCCLLIRIQDQGRKMEFVKNFIHTV